MGIFQLQYNLMGLLLYMLSVVDQNVIMNIWHEWIYWFPPRLLTILFFLPWPYVTVLSWFLLSDYYFLFSLLFHDPLTTVIIPLSSWSSPSLSLSSLRQMFYVLIPPKCVLCRFVLYLLVVYCICHWEAQGISITFRFIITQLPACSIFLCYFYHHHA